jgi:PKD repeat protein
MDPRGGRTAHSGWRRHGPASFGAVLLLASVALLMSLGPSGIGGSNGVAIVGVGRGVALAGPVHAVRESSLVSSTAPNVTLGIDQSIGTAPFFANVTVTASGGQPPYNLTFCPSGTGLSCERDSVWAGTPWKMEISHTDPGNYTVQASVVDANGSIATASAMVEVRAVVPLSATVTEGAASGVAPFTDSFQTSIAGGHGPYRATWIWGDGTQNASSSLAPLNHTYTAAGTYIPRVTVADSQGRMVTHDLPAVKVTNLPVGQSGPTVAGLPAMFAPLLIGALAILVVVGATGTYVWRERQIRRDSFELVSQLWEGESPDSENELRP